MEVHSKEKEIKNFKFKKLYPYLYTIVLVLLVYIYIPKITLYGDKHMIINYRDGYKEPGYSAKFTNKDITNNLIIDKRLDTSHIGKYHITYYLQYGFIKLGKRRFIDVIDNIPPTINTETNLINICPKEHVDKIEYTAIDEYDGDITSDAIATYEEEKITIKVADKTGNETISVVEVVKSDKDAPVITLSGNSTMYISLGATYNEPGYTATDNCDGDITDRVVVTGTVEKKVGTYKIVYQVTDDEGNVAEAVRTVNVINGRLYNSGTITNGAVYLTFDDGPASGTTNVILDILKEEGVKATFFVTCKGPDELIKRMYDEGHTIAVHTATHDYAYIYSSVENYFEDLNRVVERVKRITGEEPKILRFPGGSSNTVSRRYKSGIMTTLTSMVLDMGYRYFDWNVDAHDASSAKNSSDVYRNVVNGLSGSKANVVLMHDIKTMTRDALRDIIRYGKNAGYTFKRIEMDTYMVRHSVNN